MLTYLFTHRSLQPIYLHIGLFKLGCKVKRKTGTVGRLNCRAEQYVHLVRVDNSRALRLYPPEHCDSIENIHRESNTLMRKIDTYERDCLSSWAEAKESTEVTVEDVSKRMRASIAEQQAFLHSVKRRDDELILQLNNNKLAQELSDRKKELKAVMFGNKLASFIAFPSMGLTSLGELAFTDMQLPFNHLDMASAELKPVGILCDYDFLLPLDGGQCIVTCKRFYHIGIDSRCFTQMNSFDRAGRLIGTIELDFHVQQDKVAQCGPDAFIVSHGVLHSQFTIYDSRLTCLRVMDCRCFSQICCNSKFVFGYCDASYMNNLNVVVFMVDPDDDHDDEDYGEYSDLRIRVHHLETLRTAFSLLVPAKYTIERIMADERHVVAMSRLINKQQSRDWYMTIFDLQEASAEKNGNKNARKFFLAKTPIQLTIEPFFLLSSVFLFSGWLLVPCNRNRELVWFDKKGKRSETSTELNNISHVPAIYSLGFSLLFALVV